jgi:DNA-binding protein HU-beta
MNKVDLINAIADETGLSKTKSNEALNAIVSAISGSLSKGEKVTLVGFGTFTTLRKESRKGRNPKTGEVITIPAKNVARFKAGSELVKNVN